MSDKGYVIGLMKVKETDDPEIASFVGRTITFTGYFHELNIDDVYAFTGETSDHPKYGFQYNVSTYERVKPSDKEGTILFLSSDLFKGVGEKLATKIVDALGNSALERIQTEPSCLHLVPGMTKKKALSITETLEKYEESSTIIVYLTDLGFSMREALLIYNTYKGNTITQLSHNIYNLTEDNSELSFLKIDNIATKMDIGVDDNRRIKACILYVMKKATFTSGDTYMTKEDIYQGVRSYIQMDIDADAFYQYLCELRVDDKIVTEENDYYLNNMYEAERNILYTITKLLTKKTDKYPKLEALVESLEKNNSIVYNKKQKEAISKAIINNISIITGGPGTGKTTIIKAIIDTYIKLYDLDIKGNAARDIALLAPTGRAAKRMSESTIFSASTIHRFLKWNKDTGEFAVNSLAPAECKLIIIDEVSMIDIELFHHLLCGLKKDIKLVLVGDFNQLPSVGPGQLLKDFIESGKIETVELDWLYRQDENSYITELAHEIKEDDLTNFLDAKSDYQFLECTSEAILPNLQKICKQVMDKGYDYKKLQLMAPMYRGMNGIDTLNMALQDVFNPKEEGKEELVYEGVMYRENDKILQLVNVPDDNIYNGDIGVISRIVKAKNSSSKKNEIYVEFDGNEIVYYPKDMSKIRHGFIISIHKSQGSEFDFVILPMSQSYHRMLYRKLVYTAVTRAKKKLIIIGQKDAFAYSVHNNAEYIRKTKFKEKLEKICINN